MSSICSRLPMSWSVKESARQRIRLILHCWLACRLHIMASFMAGLNSTSFAKGKSLIFCSMTDAMPFKFLTLPQHNQDPAGVIPLSRSELLCHLPQISRLIVGIKRTAIQPRPSVNDTDVQLRAKLHRLSRFSPHNEPNEGLAHADDPVRHAVGTVIAHVPLLLIDG